MHDRLDLGLHGVPIPLPNTGNTFGEHFDVETIALPSRVELVLEGASFARNRLREMYPPESLLTLHHQPMLGDNAGAGKKVLSKAVLFPARLLYTLETGSLGLNEEAARHFQVSRGGSVAAALVQHAFDDRAIR